MKELISFTMEAFQNLNGINLVNLQTILNTYLVVYFELTKTIIQY